MKRTIRFLGLLACGGSFFFAGMGLLGGSNLYAQCCGQPVVTQRVVYKTIWERQPVTAYRLQTSQVIEEQEVTVQIPEWVKETRQRKYTVSKPVTETETREERYTVLRPVTETAYREEEYDETTFVTETENRQERIIVNRPIQEQRMEQQQYTVRRAVQDTVYQDQMYTTYSPVTSYYNQTVDVGGYVTQWAYYPGTARTSLRWVPRGYATDQATGVPFYHRAGLHWVPSQTPGVAVPTTSYMPNYQTQQVPVTSYQPQVVAQKVPVNVTRFVDDVVTTEKPVTYTRYEQVEEVREYPVQVQKPRVERKVRKIPVSTTRMVPEEYVRPVTYAVQKIVTEDIVENYDVQVQQVRYETKKIQVPKTVSNWVEYQTYKLVPKTVMVRVPVGAYDDLPIDGTVTNYAPAAAPTLPPERRVISEGPPRRVYPSGSTTNGTSGASSNVQRPAEATVPVQPRSTEPANQAPAVPPGTPTPMPEEANGPTIPDPHPHQPAPGGETPAPRTTPGGEAPPAPAAPAAAGTGNRPA